jgi:integrase
MYVSTKDSIPQEQTTMPAKAEEKRTRRSNGEGSPRLRKDGRWQVQYYNEDRQRKTVYGKTRKEALEKMKARQTESLPAGKMTLDTWTAEWLASRRNYSAGTYQWWTYALKRINRRFGELPLTKITTDLFERWITEMCEEGLAPKTIRNHCTFLGTVLKGAARKKLIATNPYVDDIELPKVQKKEPPSLSLEQAYHFMEQLHGHRLEAIVTLALATGMRLGELLSLKWIDIEGGIIFVCRNVTYVKKGHGKDDRHVGFIEGPPKSDSGRRQILLVQFAIDALKAHRIRQNEWRLQQGQAWLDNDLVFPNPVGGYYHEYSVEKAFKKVAMKTGLPVRFTFHDLRHSTASILYAMGIDWKVIQQMLGHSTLAMTMDTYVHLQSCAQKDAIERYNQAHERVKRS